MRFPALGWTHGLLLLAACSIIGMLLGALLDAAGWGLAAGMTVWISYEVRQARQLEAWLADGSRPVRLRGLWEDLQAEVFRRRRRARKRRDRLMRRLRRFQQITEALPDAVLLCSPAGDIEWFNSASQRLLNLASTDVGNNLVSLLRHPEVAGLFQPDTSDGTLELLAPHNPNQYLELRMFPDDTGNRVVLVRDTTDARRLLTMRQDFVANVSHELRTPLTVVVGYLEALDDVEELDPALFGNLAQRLQSPVQRMKALVDDLLLLSRLEASQASADGDAEAVDVPATLRRVLADAEQVSGGLHKFDLQVDNNLLLEGAALELHSTMDNLVMNAVRYSPEGGAIRISWALDSSGAPCFQVRDSGIGIAPEHMDRLTERFYRVDLGRSRNRGGTGLGLAIVKHVLRRHESSLAITSTLGKGSTFSCSFPASRLRPRPERTTARPSEPGQPGTEKDNPASPPSNTIS